MEKGCNQYWFRVGWGQMSMVGQRGSDDNFVSGAKAKELMIIGSSILLFLFQWKNKNVDLSPMGYLIFGVQNKIPSDLLCSTIPILPHPTLYAYVMSCW